MKIHFKTLINLAVLLSVILLSSFQPNISPQIKNPKTLAENENNIGILPISSSWVDSVYKSLTMEEKIGQLFMVSAYSNKKPSHTQHIIKLIKKYHIGGLIFFQGTPEKQVKLTRIYQNYSKTPLMIAMDAEWGLGMRLDKTISYPRQMALGAIQNDSLIYQMGHSIGKQLKRLGVQINFAPVVDINNNPANPVIGSRSFGEDKYNVARKGIAYMNGLQDNNILAVAKHFPGHGDTDSDSHKTLPVIKHDSARLDSIELYPFKQLINNGVGGIMTAHLHIPAYIQEPNKPSTLSDQVVSELLKKDLNFRGLIFTDALNMKGVTNYYKPGEIEAKALEAGNDVLLYPQDVPKAISYIKKQIRKGNIDKKRVEESCKKILAFKYWAGLDKMDKANSNDQQILTDSLLSEDLHKPEYYVEKRALIENSMTLIKNKDQLLPLTNVNDKKITSIALGASKITSFQKMLDKNARVNHLMITSYNFDQNLQRECKKSDLVIISTHNTNESPYNNYGISKKQFSLIKEISETSKVLLVHHGNPYALKNKRGLEKVQSILIAFNDDPLTQRLSAQGIFGTFKINGLLPVTIDKNYMVKTGISLTDKQILKYTIPEEAKLSAEVLKKIDSIALRAIENKATPGCQVFVAKDGKVVYNKSFGHHTYLKKRPVKNNDLYDIASLTKIVATVPSLMKLFEEKVITLEDSLGKFLPELDTTNKTNLVLKDILTHQARLKSWIPFYQSTLQTLFPGKELLSTKPSEEYPFKIGKHAYMAKNFIYKDSIFKHKKSKEFSIQVADNLYMKNSYKDTIYKNINQSELLDKKEYVYSDLGYYYLFSIIERLNNKNFEDFVYRNFYKPMNAVHTCFLPLEKFSKKQIVPTENDMVFRKQLLQGYVHDPGAAMLGGVCGHAGVFSNAGDLGKIMQMYLNEGFYGGKRYFSPETIQLFTSSPYEKSNDNRRAIGFDKPILEEGEPGPTCKEVSAESFGHSGFTGTIAWADPKDKIVYVFLSNRIHPDQDNRKLIENDVRTKIQKVIYDAILN
jgi:beta-glucosidase-like glycosyl hydrolase/CubicO group peptidase (beta-lactamase class C family)